MPNAALRDVQQVASCAQTAAHGMIQTPPDDSLRLIGLPLSFGNARPPCARRAPALGEGTTLIVPHADGTEAPMSEPLTAMPNTPGELRMRGPATPVVLIDGSPDSTNQDWSADAS